MNPSEAIDRLVAIFVARYRFTPATARRVLAGAAERRGTTPDMLAARIMLGSVA